VNVDVQPIASSINVSAFNFRNATETAQRPAVCGA